MDIAKRVARRSPCSRRKFGAIILKNGSVVATGYNGSAKGSLNCGFEIECLKDLHKEDPYTSYKYCPAVHAEDNAISQAGWERTKGATMYLAPYDEKDSLPPCEKCRAKILNAEIEHLYFRGRGGTLKYLSREQLLAMENEWMMNTYESGKENYVDEKLNG